MSQAPTWRAGANVRLAPRTLTMRVYAVATPNGYEVMPGGLARIAAEGVVDIVSSSARRRQQGRLGAPDASPRHTCRKRRAPT